MLYIQGKNDNVRRQVRHLPNFNGAKTHRGKHWCSVLLLHEQGATVQTVRKDRIRKLKQGRLMS